MSRPRNKSPVEAPEPAGDAPPSKSRYYEERPYRERERERERGERESGRSRDTERERDRDRERREESHRSRH